MPPDPTPPPRQQRPPTLTKAPPAERKFPCPQCGARLDFDPSVRSLKCPYCGHEEKIAPAESSVEERDFEEYLQRQASHQSTIEGRSSQVRCTGCGATVLLEDKVVTERCPYCGTHLENAPETAQEMIPPEGILPFQVELRKARAAFDRWLEHLWFAPNELKKLAALGQLNGVYIPYWTYDAMTFSQYQGMRGDDYFDTETYTEQDENGNTVTRTRTVTRTNWYPVAGEVQHFFDDVLICASKSLPENQVEQLTPWHLQHLTGFKPEYLSGFKTERYAIGLKEGFHRARTVMEAEIQQLCARDIGGDHQVVETVHTQYMGVTFKQILLPVWLASYRYRDRVYRLLVNAQTGEVVGERPYSVAKIVALIAVVLVLVVLLILLFSRAGGRGSGTMQRDLPARFACVRGEQCAEEDGFPMPERAWHAIVRQRPLPLFAGDAANASAGMTPRRRVGLARAGPRRGVLAA